MRVLLAGSFLSTFGIFLSIPVISLHAYKAFHLSAVEAVGFAAFVVESQAYAMTIAAVCVFSLGEAFLFPCFEVFIDRIAPQQQKALYFGAGELKQLGFFLGPVLGGQLMAQGGHSLLFGSCVVAILVAAWALRLSVCSVPANRPPPEKGYT